MNKISKFDSLAVGIIIGLLIPVISFFIFYHVTLKPYARNEYLFEAIVKGAMLGKILSLCIIPNLVPFFIFIWLNFLRTTRGVLSITVFLAIASAIMKFAM